MITKIEITVETENGNDLKLEFDDMKLCKKDVVEFFKEIGNAVNLSLKMRDQIREQ